VTRIEIFYSDAKTKIGSLQPPRGTIDAPHNITRLGILAYAGSIADLHGRTRYCW
jgi:hypothetical protein